MSIATPFASCTVYTQSSKHSHLFFYLVQCSIVIIMFTFMPMSESIHNFPGLKVKVLAKTGNEHWKLDYSSMVGDASPLKLHFKCNRISYECSVRYGLLRFKWHNQFYRVCVWEKTIYTNFCSLHSFVLFTLVFCCCCCLSQTELNTFFYVVPFMISLQLVFFRNRIQKNN